MKEWRKRPFHFLKATLGGFRGFLQGRKRRFDESDQALLYMAFVESDQWNMAFVESGQCKDCFQLLKALLEVA